MIWIKVKLLRMGARLPEYKTAGAAGADIYFAPADGLPKTLQPHEIALLNSGFSMEIPPGYEIQVRARSGLALKHGITVLNGIGTIDSDYRGEIGAILINHGTEPFTFNPGDRIAQLVVGEITPNRFITVDQLTETARGTGGYGSTGVGNNKTCGVWSEKNPESCPNPRPCPEHAGKCTSPNGRIDVHLSYVKTNAVGDLVCEFCDQSFAPVPTE